MGLRRYLDLVRAPGAARLIAATAIGRLPYGMNLLALILLLRAEGFAYAEVGVITGASGLAIGAAAPVLGRLIDGFGQTPVLLATAGMCAAADAALVLAALSGAGTIALVLLAALAGAATPPVSPCMRALWPRLVPSDRLDTAFAFDALQLEVVFILGPLLAAGLAAAISPEVAFITGATLQCAGAVAFAAAPASRGWRSERPADEKRRGALSAPGMRAFVAALALGGVALGILEIGIAAFAESQGSRSDSGWLFALWGAGSLTGGLWYGAREWRSGAWRRFLILTAAFAVGMAPLFLAGSLVAFGPLIVVAGLALAPVTAAAYSLIGELAPSGALTEAYAWQIVAYVAGGAFGAWLAGVLIDELSVRSALAAAPVAAGLGFLVALAAHRGRSARAEAVAR
jgi:MFS family permease